MQRLQCLQQTCDVYCSRLRRGIGKLYQACRQQAARARKILLPQMVERHGNLDEPLQKYLLWSGSFQPGLFQYFMTIEKLRGIK